MRSAFATTAAIAAALLLSACASAPSSIVAGPTTARPLPPPYPPLAQNNGAIYQSNTYRPAFEDRRARHVGDVINVVITENTAAVKNGIAYMMTWKGSSRRSPTGWSRWKRNSAIDPRTGNSDPSARPATAYRWEIPGSKARNIMLAAPAT